MSNRSQGQAERNEVKSKAGIAHLEKVSQQKPRSKAIRKLEKMIKTVTGSLMTTPMPTRVLPWGLDIIEDSIHPDDKRVLQEWHKIFAFSCLFALLVDPMFGYTLFVDDEKGCLHVDKKLAIAVIFSRCVIDLVYAFHIILKLFSFVVGYRATNKDATKKCLKITVIFFYLLIDVLALAPVPQVILFGIIQRTTCSTSKLLVAIKGMNYVIIAQFLPRSARLFPLHHHVMGWNNPRRSTVTVWAKSAFNLALYILASHVFGAYWYFSAVQRELKCWEMVYRKEAGRDIPSLNFDVSDIPNSILQEYCPVNPPNTTRYDFGIYLEALQSGVGHSSNLFRKFCFSFLWGLQSLSSLGQGLKTSADIDEIIFAVVISISGLVLFAFLIGNMQAYFQAGAQRSEQMRLKTEEIELWMTFHLFPRDLRKKIRGQQECVWRKTRGVDVESALINLPRELRRDIKRHLCEGFRKVHILNNMKEHVLDEIYDRLNPKLYVEKSYLIKTGDVLDEMFIITNGKLAVLEPTSTDATTLDKGDVYGHDVLFDWAFRSNSLSESKLPLSTKTLQTRTNVEAFVLTASDLQHIVSRYRSIFAIQLNDFPDSREHLVVGAVVMVQLAWRRKHNKDRYQ